MTKDQNKKLNHQNSAAKESSGRWSFDCGDSAERGFTIVEVLISLIIFALAVAGVITVAFSGGVGVDAAKNQLTASYLADEGIELMRGMRDSAIVAAPSGGETAAWTAFVTAVTTVCGTGASTPCDIDVTNAAGSAAFPAFSPTSNFVICPPAGCVLNYNASTGYYNDQPATPGNAPSIFSRSLVVVPVSGTTDEVEVLSTVSWKEGTLTQSISETEDMFDWY